MNAARLFEWTQDNTRTAKLVAVPLLIALMISVYAIVYSTGGIKYVYSHSMYLPIILAGLIFGIRGGILAGAAGGIILGPFMPISVITGEPQEPINWLYRAGFFIIVGFLIGAASDSTQQYLNRIKWFLRHDVLSGLPNRFALVEAMADIKGAREAHEPGSLAIVSLDNVAEMESAYGPDVTDAIVNQLAERLNKLLGKEIIVYRTNTHQLGVLLPQGKNQKNERLLDELTKECRQPFAFRDIALHGDVRIGYAELSNFEDAPEHYLRQAEVALRAASEKSQSWMLFTPELDTATTKENLELLGELKEALECGQLSLHYQPKISILSGAVQGVEALMRWQHPRLGNILPQNFIPRAEKSVLIDVLTEWAIDNALAQQVRWKEEGIELPVAVNISPRNLLQPGFVDTVLRLLEHHQVSGDSLELEVTEGALMLDIDRTIVKLIELSEVNIIISIDDFGTGYSSLRYLGSLPATTIKVDQSFISALRDSAGSAHIIEAAVNLAHGLEMKVVAEGVEDKDTYDFLANIGCDIAQGYFISPAIPASDLSIWYKERNGNAVSK